MEIFFMLLSAILPLYVLIALGFVAGRFFEADRATLANLAIFIFMPVVVFGFVADLEFRASYIALPFIVYAVNALIGLSMLKIGRKIYHGPEANILAMAASMGNTGYFGLPLVFALFDHQHAALYIFAMLGGAVYEATIGYYIAARGRFDVKTSLLKLAKFPGLYAMALAFAFKAAEIQLGETFHTYWGYFKGAYVLSGMMLIGVALSRVKKFVIGPRFLTLAFTGKFVLWPGLIGLWIALDKAALHMFTPDIYSLMLVMAVVPPAANIVAFATQLDLVPEKAATTILIGTLVALVYIPAILVWAGMR